jgi:hypothetical protein
VEAVVNGNPLSPRRSPDSCIHAIPILALFAGSLVAAPASAQGTARSMDIDVSIRSAALGGASNALFWGEERDHWGNPALLGYEQGIRYEHGNTQLVPGLASDVTFATDVVKAGGGGVGVVFSGQPWNKGGVDLDYGASQGTDVNGNPTGVFGSYEKVRSWGFGVSALSALAGLTALGGGKNRHWARYGDLSFGMNFKDVTVALAPSSGIGTGSTTARDFGVLARVTPFDGLSDEHALPLRLDLSYGYSQLSCNDDAVIHFLTEADRVSRHERDGVGIHLAADPMRGQWPRKGLLSVLGPGLAPLLSVGFTSDRARITPGPSGGYDTHGYGVELAVARVFAIRTGHYVDQTGYIDGSTSGWSVGLPLGRWGGGYYEEAMWPQANNSGLPDVHRKGFGLWIDAMAIWRSARGTSGT